MIGLMEAAGYNALEPFLEGDEVSVGTAINIVHRAPATVGMKIKAEAVLENFDGRFYTFKVSATTDTKSSATALSAAPLSARLSLKPSRVGDPHNQPTAAVRQPCQHPQN